MRKHSALALLLCISLMAVSPAAADETRIPPAYPVPEEITWLLEVAQGEIGYQEGDHGWTKYGEWAGDPYAQWCAEYLCWCVNQVDEIHGTHLLNQVYPLYSGSNTGRSWFISQGRYLVNRGPLEGWGYQWIKGSDHFHAPGDYIPQPGDWVFFTWTSDQETDHVAMVEYCTMDENGHVTIHCLEGNTPASVKRASYDLDYRRILGYGTVHDVAGWTMRSGNRGPKVQQLQEKLIALNYLAPGQADGVYGSATAQAVRSYQEDHGLKVTSIANLETQSAIDRQIERTERDNASNWIVSDAGQDDDFDLDHMTDLDALLQQAQPTPAPEDGDWLISPDDGGR